MPPCLGEVVFLKTREKEHFFIGIEILHDLA